MNTSSLTVYEAYAVRLGGSQRKYRDNFIFNTNKMSSKLVDLDFFMWVLRSSDHIVVIDTGFSSSSGNRRSRKLDVSPQDALAALNIDICDVDDLIITHLHFDHAGNINDFPSSRIHIQAAEMDYATGEAMCCGEANKFFEPEDVSSLLEKIYSGHVEFHKGDVQMNDGLSLHKVGGHTGGLQIVRVRTARGWVVLASDLLHFYDNYRLNNPFPAVTNLSEIFSGYRLIKNLASSDDHIVPGHDAQVRTLYKTTNVNGVHISFLHEDIVKQS